MKSLPLGDLLVGILWCELKHWVDSRFDDMLSPCANPLLLWLSLWYLFCIVMCISVITKLRAMKHSRVTQVSIQPPSPFSGHVSQPPTLLCLDSVIFLLYFCFHIFIFIFIIAFYMLVAGHSRKIVCIVDIWGRK